MSQHRLPNDIATSDWEMVDPGKGGVINANQPGVVQLRCSENETRTIAAPHIAVGCTLTLVKTTATGVCTVSSTSPLNAAGNNTIALDSEGEMITLVAVEVGSSVVWRVFTLDGATLSTV